MVYNLYDFKKNKTFQTNFISKITNLNLISTLIFILIIAIFKNLKFYNLNLFFNHIILSASLVTIFIVILCLALFNLFLLSSFTYINSLESSEFLISLLNFFILSPFLFSSTSILTFIVVLEVLSIIATLSIYNSVAMSSIFNYKTNYSYNYTSLNKNFNFINAFLINFWVSLLSSLFFFLTILGCYFFLSNSD